MGPVRSDDVLRHWSGMIAFHNRAPFTLLDGSAGMGRSNEINRWPTWESGRPALNGRVWVYSRELTGPVSSPSIAR